MKKRNNSRLRYKDILNENFLRKEYTENKKSLAQLQKELKIYRSTIKYYLQLNKIPIRSHKEQASISSPGGKYLYDYILTKNSLINEYIKNKKGVLELSKNLKVDRGTIKRYLNKYNISQRSSKEQNLINNPPKIFKINKEIKSFIDGLLLGDASIPQRKDGIAPRSLTQACKHKEYLEYIEDRLNHYGVVCSPILSRWIKDIRCKNRGYFQSFLQTRRYKTFEVFRERFYPSGIKIVPSDLILTKDLLLQLYLCDGNFYRHITLCLNAFNLEDISFLKDLIERELSIILTLRKQKDQFMLVVKKSDAKKFTDYIGPCPIKCYEYKWEDNESEEAKHRKRLKAKLRYKESKNASKRIQEKKRF